MSVLVVPRGVAIAEGRGQRLGIGPRATGVSAEYRAVVLAKFSRINGAHVCRGALHQTELTQIVARLVRWRRGRPQVLPSWLSTWYT